MGWHWFGTPEGATALWWESLRAAFAGEPVTQAVDLIRTAVEIERAAVVEWVRENARQNDDGAEDIEDDVITDLLCELAEAIERGEHRG